MITRKRPENPQRHYVPIVRPTATQAIRCQPLVDEHEVFIVHRNLGRTIPCMGRECLLCVAMIPREDRIFLPVWLLDNVSLAIVDLPASHHETLVGMSNKYRSLRQCILLIQRARSSDNAPINIRSRHLSGGERVRDPYAELGEQLDAIFASNYAYAIQDITNAKTADGGSPLLSDRQRTRPQTPGNLPDVTSPILKTTDLNALLEEGKRRDR